MGTVLIGLILIAAFVFAVSATSDDGNYQGTQAMTDHKGLIERLITAKDDDHERGCQMRFAMCTCGFDDACARTAGEAAQVILDLTAEVARLKAAFGEAWEALSRIADASECDASRAAAREALGKTSQALEGDSQ